VVAEAVDGALELAAGAAGIVCEDVPADEGVVVVSVALPVGTAVAGVAGVAAFADTGPTDAAFGPAARTISATGTAGCGAGVTTGAGTAEESATGCDALTAAAAS
jgi:hypothetical protein